jgi:hypothetical protein
VGPLAYKPNATDVLERLRGFYGRKSGDRIFAVMEVPSSALRDFEAAHPRPECGYPNPLARAEFWDRYFCERAPLEDDSLPAAYLSEFDQGLYGGLLGGDVRFVPRPEVGWISSMVPPLLKDWSQFRHLRFDPAHSWWGQYLRQLRIFAERSSGKWGISHFILIDSLNFIFELVGGTNAFLSLKESPDEARRAMDFGHELNVCIQEAFFENVGLFEGGTFSNHAQWIPGRIVSESLDPFHLASAAYFEQWGREPAERMLDAFDGGMVHIHGNGRHLLSAAAALRGLKAIYLADDPGYPPALDTLAELKTQTGDVPLVVAADYEPFAERLRRRALPGQVLYKVKNVPDIAAANRLMEKVRTYRVGEPAHAPS